MAWGNLFRSRRGESKKDLAPWNDSRAVACLKTLGVKPDWVGRFWWWERSIKLCVVMYQTFFFFFFKEIIAHGGIWMLVALSLSFLFVKGTTSYTDGRAHTEVRSSLGRKKRVLFIVISLCFIEVIWWWKMPDDYNHFLKELNSTNIAKGEQLELCDGCLV